MGDERVCMELHEQPDFQEWQATLTAYQLAYGFLSKALYEPPRAEFVRQLFADDLFADWPLSAADQDTQTGLQLLRACGADWNPDALRDDYAALFVGPPLLAYPWESVYRSEEGIIFDEVTLQVREAYRHFGLQVPRAKREPDDHIGLEMAFMVHLCGLGIAACEQEDMAALDETLGAQRSFLADHLLCWATACLGLVIQHARTDYYRGIAHLAVGTLRAAADLFALEFDPPSPR